MGEAELASQSLQRAQAEEARLSESSAKQTERIELLQRSLSEAKDRLRSQSADVSRLASASSESRADHEATVQSLRSAIAALHVVCAQRMRWTLCSSRAISIPCPSTAWKSILSIPRLKAIEF